MTRPVENTPPISDSEIHRDPPDFAPDEVLARIQHNFRWPKPNDEAVASALRAIQKVAVHATAEEYGNGAHASASPGCPKCGESNSSSNRFCGYCGNLSQTRGSRPPSSANGEQHMYHHHYHHHFFESEHDDNGGGKVQGRTTSSRGGEKPEQAAADVLRLVRDWGLHCNSKRLDELVALYSPEAIVLRPDAAPARGLPAIREMFKAALDAGLGDVELDASDMGMLGAIACLTGPSRMLVTMSGGKRQERSGKYLIVARCENGNWKILADIWSLDSVVERPIAAIVTKPERKVS